MSSFRRDIIIRNNQYHSVYKNFRKLFNKYTYNELRVGYIVSDEQNYSKLKSEFMELYFKKYKDLPVLNFKK